MRPLPPNALAVIPWLAAALALTGCGAKHESPAGSSRALPAAQVRVQTVEEKTRTTTEEVVGTLRAKLRATLEAKVSGRIEAMPVLLGQKVEKGQLIARLDAGEIAARLDQANASLDQANRDWSRMETLYKQANVTRAEYDTAEARLRVARAAVAEAEAMMRHAEITAPFDGVVTKKWADVGDLAAPGKPLIDLVDPSVLQLEADIPETMGARLRRDSRLPVRVDAADRELEGVVSEIAPAVDPASRTFRVKLNLPSVEGLMPGQFARVSVPIGERRSVRVPATAVVQRGQLEMVFAVTNQCAVLHLVKTGRQIGDEIEVLSGLNAGDTVVVSGADQLIDGQPVEAR